MKTVLTLVLIVLAISAYSQTDFRINFEERVQLVEASDTLNTMFVQGVAKIKIRKDEEPLLLIVATETRRDTITLIPGERKKYLANYLGGNQTFDASK